MKPYCWSLEELSPLLKRSAADHVPLPTPVVRDPSPATYSPELPQNSHDEPDEVVVPVSGPPIAWIKKEGPTEGCNACNQYRREGKIHGKVHSQACKQRYKEFLEDERRKKRKLEASPTPPVPVSMDVDAPPRTLPPAPALVPVPSSSPQSFSPVPVPASQSPDPASSSAAAPVPASGDAPLGDGVEDMAVEPTGDAMELDLLIDYTTPELADPAYEDLKSAGLPAVREGERQVVKLPSSCRDARGHPVFLDLLKALYGLRRAPVYWYRELKRALLKLGFEITADAAVFRHYSSEFGLVLVVVYVDDCLFAGAHESCLHFIAALASGYEVKPTGELKHGVVGCVEFLGKEVKREEPGGSLLIGLPSSYWDGIESASGLTFKPQDNPPDLSKFVDCETAQLKKLASEKYRTVLGKLAWYSLTLPPLQYYVSWLSCYQQSPLKLHGPLCVWSYGTQNAFKEFFKPSRLERVGNGTNEKFMVRRTPPGR
ncbi:Transposon Ty4-H Gag-Pol polyprotein [Symbiodinium microadriaticum]|uniref:Transposon Ty4-H Gag-Pol polyprotein n=1 Tax=Symbiodinium microadriaticum TaxID=2951 RepID=A0A1Q9C8S6_SYMMI|nr:Transposon Ty4-H Gag-Pol polyprotein [Symbiodinium microadriaticum]